MKKSVYFAIIATLFMLIVLMAFIGFVKLSVQFDDLDEIIIVTPDLTFVDDGLYEGTYELFPLSVTVVVTITNHAFEDIEIIHHSLFFNDNVDVMIEQIVNKQSLEVDISEDEAYSERILLLAIMNSFEFAT